MINFRSYLFRFVSPLFLLLHIPSLQPTPANPIRRSCSPPPSIGQRSFLPSLPVSLSAATSPAPTTAQPFSTRRRLPTAMLVPKVDQGSELLLLSLSSSAACLHAPASQFGGQAIIELATLEPN